MASAEDKHRFVILIDKELLNKFRKLAEKDNRSASNLAVKIITEYVEQHSKN